jgi:O-antigen/teichoic acid export membrane protein
VGGSQRYIMCSWIWAVSVGFSRDPAWVRILPDPIRSYFTGRVNLHAVIQNSGWLLFDKLVRVIVGLLVGAWVARYLGPAQFGELAYVLAYIAMLQTVVVLGLDSIIVREIVLHRERAASLLGTAFALRVGSGIGAWLLAILCMALLNGWANESVSLIALAGGSLVFQAADTIDLWFQSQSQSRRTVIAKLVAHLLSSSMKVALIFMEAPLVAFAAILTLEALIAAAGLMIAYKNFSCGQVWQSISTQARILLTESWPYILSGLSIMVYMRIDQIMIKEILGGDELGLYAVILPISNLWHIFPVAICLSITPFISKKKAEGEEAYYAALTLIFRVMLATSIIVAVVTAMLAQFVVSFLYGDAYSGAAKILRIHAFTNIPVFLGVAQSLWFANEKKSRLMLRNTLLGGFASLFFNYFLLPVMGVSGAAISAVISYFISAVFLNLVDAKFVFLMQLGLNLYKSDNKS